MVQIQPSMGGHLAAVLAGIAISFEEILASKLDLLHGQAIVMIQEEDFGHTNRQPDGANALESIGFGKGR